MHAVLATIFSIYCVFYTCPGEQTFFNDKECREVPRNSHVWTCMFTATYLTVDTFWLVFFMGVKEPIDK